MPGAGGNERRGVDQAVLPRPLQQLTGQQQEGQVGEVLDLNAANRSCPLLLADVDHLRVEEGHRRTHWAGAQGKDGDAAEGLGRPRLEALEGFLEDGHAHSVGLVVTHDAMRSPVLGTVEGLNVSACHVEQ